MRGILWCVHIQLVPLYKSSRGLRLCVGGGNISEFLTGGELGVINCSLFCSKLAPRFEQSYWRLIYWFLVFGDV